MGHGKEFVFILNEMKTHWSIFRKGAIGSGFVLR